MTPNAESVHPCHMTTTRAYKPTTTNILRTYYRATDDQIASGIAWYATAHDAALELDPRHPDRAAAIIAALSPRKSWEANLIQAKRAYADGQASKTLGDHIRKVNRLLAGEKPLDVLGGNKVRSFYAAILDPSDPDAVAVDRHAVDVAIGRRLSEADRAALRLLERKGQYEVFANAYRRAAHKIGVSPSQLQAITWLVWRDEYRWTRTA